MLGIATALPAIILLCIFTVYPVIYLVYGSLFDGSLISKKMNFVGLENYVEILTSEPVGIAALKSSETLQMWHIIMAGNVVLVLPILIIYILASKKIRTSFTYSDAGIK